MIPQTQHAYVRNHRKRELPNPPLPHNLPLFPPSSVSQLLSMLPVCVCLLPYSPAWESWDLAL
ncbi:hypothetical protein FKM82_003498 [Ascaphus truei]